MCAGCSGGGRPGPSWEDAAGRLDAAGQRARGRAVRRLLAGSRWKAEPWHGSWTVTGPTGQRHHAADLDALFRLVPAPRWAGAGGPTRATAPAPLAWHVQAGLVWVAAARAAELVGAFFLPLGGDAGLQLRLGHGGHVEVGRARGGRLEVEAAQADLVLASLLDVAGPALSPGRGG